MSICNNVIDLEELLVLSYPFVRHPTCNSIIVLEEMDLDDFDISKVFPGPINTVEEYINVLLSLLASS